MLQAGQEVLFDYKKYFKYIKPLGSGGTGDTHLFLDETTGMRFAIKKYVPKEQNDIEDNYRRFVEEIKILLNLSHPNIVRVYNYYLYPNQNTGFLQMEFIDGTPISEFVCIGNKNWNDLFVETVRAFKYLEDNNVLHRDIRPANIMIDINGNIKIIDFGFGKKISVKDNSNSILLNWPVTEMPEEVKKHGKYNHKTEVYFLGKLFDSLPLNENCSFEFSHVIDKMSRIKEDERYKSFSEVALAISEGIVSVLDFTEEQKNIYVTFADYLCSKITKYNKNFNYNSNIKSIIEGLAKVLKVNSLERIIQNNSELIKCFLKCGFTYRNKKDIPVHIVRNFYVFLNSLSYDKQQIVLDNIVARLSMIEIDVFYNDDDVPF